MESWTCTSSSSSYPSQPVTAAREEDFTTTLSDVSGECRRYEQEAAICFLESRALAESAQSYSASAGQFRLRACLERQKSQQLCLNARAVRLMHSFSKDPMEKKSSLAALYDETASQQLDYAKNDIEDAQQSEELVECLQPAAALAGEKALFYAKNEMILKHGIEHELECLKNQAQCLLESAHEAEAQASLDEVDGTLHSARSRRLFEAYQKIEALYRKAFEEFEIESSRVKNCMQRDKGALLQTTCETLVAKAAANRWDPLSEPSSFSRRTQQAKAIYQSALEEEASFAHLEMQALTACYQDAAALCQDRAAEARRCVRNYPSLFELWCQRHC